MAALQVERAGEGDWTPTTPARQTNPRKPGRDSAGLPVSAYRAEYRQVETTPQELQRVLGRVHAILFGTTGTVPENRPPAAGGAAGGVEVDRGAEGVSDREPPPSS